MAERDWNPWKMTTFGLLLVGATALVTTLIMSYRDEHTDVKQTRTPSRANASARKAPVPSQVDVDACQNYAHQRIGDATMGVVKEEVAIGDVEGAGVGAAGGGIADRGNGAVNGVARNDARYQAAYRSCMRQKGY